MRPALVRYSKTTLEPGARLVLTQGLDVRPLATAFCASRPAPIMTDGFEVLVQLVIAAMTTAPLEISACSPWISSTLFLEVASLKASLKFLRTSGRVRRS